MIVSNTSHRLIRSCLALSRFASTQASTDAPLPTSVSPSHPPSPRSRGTNQATHDRPRDSSESKVIHCIINGITASFDDITRLLTKAGYTGPMPKDYVLRRQRRLQTTHLTMSFEDEGQGGFVNRALRREHLNGRALYTRAMQYPRMPPKYDPLHVSPQSGPGKVVSIEGLPYTANEERLRTALAGYDLVDNMDFQFFLVRRIADVSIWLVRLKSEDEAQRLVRNLNCTYYRRRQSGESFPIKAEVFS